jgi:2,3-bisphosphoglycerate-independent phosphoglycerate mutase
LKVEVVKYCIIVPDGMADEPVEALGKRTPLEAARTPNLDGLAAEGQVGLARLIPAGMPPGSDVANLSLIGYAPEVHYGGRAPLEAAAMGLTLAPGQVAFRANLVTVVDGVMKDYSAGGITTREARVLIEALNQALGDQSSAVRFYPGVSYRHVMVYSGAERMDLRTTPPHDILDQPVAKHLPSGAGAEVIRELMEASRAVLEPHDINRVRLDLGENPATQVWLWGEGPAPKVPPFRERWGLSGAVITAVDLIRGLAHIIGWDVVEVPGATGYYDTDYAAKGLYAIGALAEHDLVYVHIEAPDEAGHHGDHEAKVEAIQRVDRDIVGPVVKALRRYRDYRLLVLPDHPTPIARRTHTAEPVPFVMCGRDVPAGRSKRLTEASAAAAGLVVDPGCRLMEYFLRGGLLRSGEKR